MNELALFAGAGGGVLGSRLLGHRIVCYVERDPYCVKVLKQRIADGFIDDAPIWDDVRTFDGKPWRGVVDCVSGGFPCQDISSAGTGAGIDGERSGLWREFARIIGEVRPRVAFVENSPMLTVRGLGRVLGDLAEMGFDAEWCCLSAASQGAPHIRDRIWILANATRIQPGRQEQWTKRERIGTSGESDVTDADCEQSQDWRKSQASPRSGDVAYANGKSARWPAIARRECSFWLAEPAVGRVAHGVAHRVDRLRAIGNGQVPAVVRAAWELLSESA